MTQRNMQGKRGKTRSPVLRDNSAERQKGRKTGRCPSGNGDRLPCFLKKKGKCTQDRECDYWHPLAFLIFNKGQCQIEKGLSAYSPTKTRSIALSREKGKEKLSEQGEGTIAGMWQIVDMSSETAKNAHWTAEENPDLWTRSRQEVNTEEA